MHGWQFLPECQCAFETPKGLRGHDLAKWWGKEPAYFLLPVQPLCPPGSPAKPQDCLGTWSRAFPPFLSPVIKRQIHLLSPKPVILRLHSSSHSPTGFAETVSEIIVLGRGQAHAFLTRSQVMLRKGAGRKPHFENHCSHQVLGLLPVTPATIQVLHILTWLVDSIPDSADTEQFPHFRKFNCSALIGTQKYS